MVDDLDTIFVTWETGSRLVLIPTEDTFEVMDLLASAREIHRSRRRLDTFWMTAGRTPVATPSELSRPGVIRYYDGATVA